MNDTEPMKCAFARVLNHLTPGKYVLTNVDSMQMVRIEIPEDREKPNFLIDGMLIIAYGSVEPSLSESSESVDFCSMQICGKSIIVACLNLLGGWTVQKVKA